jgi:hypothetical protein
MQADRHRAVFAGSVSAQQKGPAASTFYLDQTETQFSLALASNSSDVYIYFTSPAYSWVGVGFGASMEKSLMLVMYANARGNGTFACGSEVNIYKTWRMLTSTAQMSP